MEKTIPAAPQPSAAGEPSAQAVPPKKSSLIGGSIKFLLATKTWSKQAAILRKRGSFPLLRDVLKNHVTSNRVVIPTNIISDHLIAKSIIGHRVILAATSLTFVYALMLFSRGLAVGVKMDAWLNGSLVLSLPLIVYSGTKILMSWKVLRVFHAELDGRRNAKAEATALGANNANS